MAYLPTAFQLVKTSTSNVYAKTPLLCLEIGFLLSGGISAGDLSR